jgi:hypothetical protein
VSQVLQLSSGSKLHIGVLTSVLDVMEGKQAGLEREEEEAACAEGRTGASNGQAEGGAVDGDMDGFDMDLCLPTLHERGNAEVEFTEEEHEAGARTAPEGAAERHAAPLGEEDATTSTSLPPMGPADALASFPPEERQRQHNLNALGALLKDAANSTAASPAMWGCTARCYVLRGEPLSAREALLKQVGEGGINKQGK